MLTSPRVLLLGNDDAETAWWEGMFREHAAIKIVHDLLELKASLEDDSFDAVFCGWTFCSGTWRQALAQVQQQRPEMPVVIVSGTADEQEWIRVLEAGAFDLLATPFQERTLLPVLEQAIALHEARRSHHAGSFLHATAS